MITSHGFYTGGYNYWYGDHNPYGINLIKEKRPDLHSWTTSSSWADMDVFFVRQIYGSIYGAGINSFIPWAGIQRPAHWIGGDPNPGNAIQVNEEGDYEVRDGYYYYKQVSLPGQPGMKIAKTVARNTNINVIGFAGDDTGHPDAFVVLNTRTFDGGNPNFYHEGDIHLTIHSKGTDAKTFKAWRTDGKEDFYSYVGEFKPENGSFEYVAPKGSVTTFYAVE